MRTRHKAYSDYGFKAGEEVILKKYIRSAEFSEHELLLQCAIEANKYLASDIYFGLVKGLGWDRMDKKSYQLCTANDYYGYQRKTLALFRETLIDKGKYPEENFGKDLEV